MATSDGARTAGCGDCGAAVGAADARWCGACGAPLAVGDAQRSRPEAPDGDGDTTGHHTTGRGATAGPRATLGALAVVAVLATAVGLAGDRLDPTPSLEDDTVTAPDLDVDPSLDREEAGGPRCGDGNDDCVRWIEPVEDGADATRPSPTEAFVVGDLLVTGDDGRVRARDARSGAERWQAEVAGAGPRDTSLLPFEDLLLHLDEAGRLVARSQRDGEVRWVSDPLPVEAQQVVAAVSDDEQLRVDVRLDDPGDGPKGRGALLAMDRSNGTWRWHQHGTVVALPLPPPTDPPTTDEPTDDELRADGPRSPDADVEVVGALQREGTLRGLDRAGDTVWEVDDQPSTLLSLVGPVLLVNVPEDGASQARLRDSGDLLEEDATVFEWDEATDTAVVAAPGEDRVQLVVGAEVRAEIEVPTEPWCGADLDAEVVRIQSCDGEVRVLTRDGDELDGDEADDAADEEAAPDGETARSPAVEASSGGDETTITLRRPGGHLSEVAHLPGTAWVLGQLPPRADDPEGDDHGTVLARGPGYLVALRVPER